MDSECPVVRVVDPPKNRKGKIEEVITKIEQQSEIEPQEINKEICQIKPVKKAIKKSQTTKKVHKKSKKDIFEEMDLPLDNMDNLNDTVNQIINRVKAKIEQKRQQSKPVEIVNTENRGKETAGRGGKARRGRKKKE